jgi:hypothetical protein
MESDLIDVRLIRDSETIAAICSDVSSTGRLLICHGCGDVEALVVGFLLLDNDQQAWALCGMCMRKLPLHGAVT